LIEPIKTVLAGLTEQTNTTHLVIKLLTHSTRTPYYLNKLAESSFINNNSEATELHQFSNDSLTLSRASTLLLVQNLETVLYPFFVSYWAVIECAFDDLIIRLIRNDADINVKLEAKNITITSPFEVGSEPWANDVYFQLKKKINNKTPNEEKSSVFKSHYYLLKVFNVNLEFDETRISHIELHNQIRNCILHNQGIISNKSANFCPELKPLVGQKIVINDDIFSKCIHSCGDYTLSWITALMWSPYLVNAVKKDSKNPFSPHI